MYYKTRIGVGEVQIRRKTLSLSITSILPDNDLSWRFPVLCGHSHNLRVVKELDIVGLGPGTVGGAQRRVGGQRDALASKGIVEILCQNFY